MNALVQLPQGFSAPAAAFAARPISDDMSAGIERGFGVIGFKGKVWSIRFRGTETKMMQQDAQGRSLGPQSYLDVVVVRASPVKSKIYYANTFVDGSTAKPDCWSTNGVQPDAAATAKQAHVCAACPRNVWGTGKEGKGKACTDSKRLAIVPAQDVKNESLGGPMLLRVPAASLGDLATFSDQMRQMGFPYNSFATRIMFDANEAYPKFTFQALRPLTDEEAKIVIEMHDGIDAKRIIAASEEMAALPAAEQGGSPFIQPTPTQQTMTPTPATTVAPPQQQASPAPMTGAASTPPAPAAAVSQQTAPAAAFASPTPAASSPAPAGTATGAAMSNGGTFTGAPAAPVNTPSPETPSSTSFEQSLDAQLDALLPK